MEFNTDEDLHTIVKYKRQVERSRGYKGIVCVDIDRLAELYEKECKFIATMWITHIIFNN